MMNISNRYEAQSVKDNLTLVVWIFVWVGTMTLSDKAALHGWWSSQWVTLASIGLNLAMGVGTIAAFLRMLRRMDDLQKKIQLDALSMALGISVVGSAAYSLLVTWGYIVDEDVSDIFVLMCVSYSAGAIYGTVRYR